MMTSASAAGPIALLLGSIGFASAARAGAEAMQCRSVATLYESATGYRYGAPVSGLVGAAASG